MNRSESRYQEIVPLRGKSPFYGRLTGRVLDYSTCNKELIRCCICDSDDYYPLTTEDRFSMGIQTVVCKVCGLVYTNPRPTRAILDDFYVNDYRRLYEATEAPSLEYIKRLKCFERANYTLDFLEDSLDPHAKVLDVGCAEGSLLFQLKERRPDVSLWGIEPTIRFAQFARDYFGLANIFNGSLEDCHFADGMFDVVVLNHVLEHLYSPARALLKTRQLLRPRGILFVEVPNVLRRWCGREWFHIGHLYNFSPATLRLLLLKSGFAPVKVDDRGTPYFSPGVRILSSKTVAVPSLDYEAKGDDWEQVRVKVLKQVSAKKGLRYILGKLCRSVLGEDTFYQIIRWLMSAGEESK